MNDSNIEVGKKVQQNKALLSALRRSDVALQFKLHMTEKGIRNVDLAERIGVSEANVSRWLRGDQNLGLDTLYLLADAIEQPLQLWLGNLHGSSCAEAPDHADSSSQEGWSALVADTVGAMPNNVIDMRAYAELKNPKVDTAFSPAKSETVRRMG